MDLLHHDVRYISYAHYCGPTTPTRLVLYMIYFPSHLKYVTVDVDMHDNRPPHSIKSTEKTYEWWLSVILAWVVLLYTYVLRCAFDVRDLTL